MIETKFVALSFYRYLQLDNCRDFIKQNKDFFKTRNLKGRIYISEEGINAQMSGIISDVDEYMVWISNFPGFENIHFKLSEVKENVFPRQIIKYRKQLVAFDKSVDISLSTTHVSPEEWNEMMNSGKYMLIDVRNDYEWKIGQFDNSVKPELETFREFPEYADNLKNQVGADKPIMMCCTGGIRCEIYSAYMKEIGFKNVYQLDGGILHYAQKMGTKGWKGKLFVFDDRLAINLTDEPAELISECEHCKTPIDVYRNCANMSCNKLFLVCPECTVEYKGCCCYMCTTSDHLRVCDFNDPKPFCRKHLIKIDNKKEEPVLESANN